MRKLFLFNFFAGCIMAAIPRGYGQDQAIVLKGALIYTAAGQPNYEKGILVVQNGRIIAVGDSTTTVPSGATIIDASHKVIIPGIVDTHSHIGNPAGGDNSNALNPEVRVLDAVNPESTSFKKALAGGITTANIMPGSGHLMSGQTIYVKLREAHTVEGLLEVNEKGVFGGSNT